MGRNREVGFPHKGWTLVDVRDSRDNDGLSYEEYPCCEFCDQNNLRYVHILEHADFPDTVSVGCNCAEQLTEDYVRPKTYEQNLRNRSNRRNNFPKLKSWCLLKDGNLLIHYESHRIIVITSAKDGFYLNIDGKPGKFKYDSIKSAQLKAFDVAEEMAKKKSNQKNASA